MNSAQEESLWFDKDLPKTYNRRMHGVTRFILLAFCTLMLFCSCASSNVEPATPKIYVTNTKKTHLLPPHLMQTPVEGVFLFQGGFAGQTFSTPVYVKADEEGIFMQLLSAFGSTVATLSFEGADVAFQSSILPEDLKAEYIVADFQFAYYDFEQTRSALASSSLIFIQESDDTGYTRSIFTKKKLIAQYTVDSASNTVVVKNHLRGYEYSLQGAPDEQ